MATLLNLADRVRDFLDRDKVKSGFQFLPGKYSANLKAGAENLSAGFKNLTGQNRNNPNYKPFSGIAKSFPSIVKSVPQLSKDTPFSRRASRMISNTGQGFFGGLERFSKQTLKAAAPQQSLKSRLTSGTGALMGFSGMAGTGTGLFTGANILASGDKSIGSKAYISPISGDQKGNRDEIRIFSRNLMRMMTGKKELASNVKDKPYLSSKAAGVAGNMVGFVKQPAWQAIFPITSKVLPLELAKNPITNFLLTRGIKGGIEGFIQAIGEISEKEPDEKAGEIMFNNLILGIGSEIAFDALSIPIKNSLGRIAKVFSKEIREQTVPVISFDVKTGKKVTKPMWRTYFEGQEGFARLDLGFGEKLKPTEQKSQGIKIRRLDLQRLMKDNPELKNFTFDGEKLVSVGTKTKTKIFPEAMGIDRKMMSKGDVINLDQVIKSKGDSPVLSSRIPKAHIIPSGKVMQGPINEGAVPGSEFKVNKPARIKSLTNEGLRARFKTKTDAELKLDIKQDWDAFGKQEIGDKFNQQQWDGVFNRAWANKTSVEGFMADTSTYLKQLGGSEQSVNKLIGKFYTKSKFGEQPPPLGEFKDKPVKIVEPVASIKAEPVKVEPVRIAPEPVKVAPEPVKIKQPVAVEQPARIKPEPVKAINQIEFKAKSRPEQIKYVKDLQVSFKDVFDRLGDNLNREKMTLEDFVSGKKSSAANSVRSLLDRIAGMIKRVDPSFNKRKDYISEMLSGQESKNVFEEVEKGIWIGAADLETGNIDKTRLGKIPRDQLERDWKVILNRYGDQVLTKLYLRNLTGETKLQTKVLDFTREVQKELLDKTGKARKIKTPDFVGIGNESSPILQKSDLELTPGGALARENNNVFSRIGGKLYKSWQDLRNIETFQTRLKDINGSEAKLDAIRENSTMHRKVLQDFVEQAGKTKFSNGTTKQYVNDTIAKLVSRRQFERNIVEKVLDVTASTLYRGHLWLKASTATKQLLEETRLPAFYKVKTIVGGLKKLNSNPVKEYKRLRDFYKLEQFDDAFDLKIFREELSSNKSISKKATKVADNIGYSLLNAGEAHKNVTYAAVAEFDGISKGKSGKELQEYVLEKIYQQANVASKYNRASVFDKSLNRLVLQYSQYNMKATRQTIDALEGKEAKKAVALMGSQLFNLAAVMSVTGLASKYALESLLPISPGPIFSVLSQAYDIYSGNYKEANKKQKAKRLALKNIVPGGSAFVTTKEGIEASKGYDESPSGRIRYFGEEASLPAKIKAAVFGKNSLKDVQKYYDEDRRILGEKQTERFLETEDKDEYAQGIIDRRKSDKEEKELVEGQNETGFKGLIQRWFGVDKVEADDIKSLEVEEADAPVMYKDAVSTLKGIDDRIIKAKYKEYDSSQEREFELQDLRDDKSKAEQMKRMIEEKYPDKVFEYELDIYESGGGQKVEDRAKWVKEQVEGKSGKELQELVNKLWDKKVITSGAKGVAAKLKEMGVKLPSYTGSMARIKKPKKITIKKLSAPARIRSSSRFAKIGKLPTIKKARIVKPTVSSVKYDL